MLNDTINQLVQHKKTVEAQIKSLLSEVSSIDSALASLSSIEAGGGGNGVPSPFIRKGKKGGMSAAGRARIAAAQRSRWAKYNAGKPPKVKTAGKKKMKFSAAGLARIKAAQKKRWAKYKQQKPIN